MTTLIQFKTIFFNDLLMDLIMDKKFKSKIYVITKLNFYLVKSEK